MSRSVFPIWVFAAVAFAIAATAFGLAQVLPGSGTVFVLAATTAWVLFVQARSRMTRNG